MASLAPRTSSSSTRPLTSPTPASPHRPLPARLSCPCLVVTSRPRPLIRRGLAHPTTIAPAMSRTGRVATAAAPRLGARIPLLFTSTASECTSSTLMRHLPHLPRAAATSAWSSWMVPHPRTHRPPPSPPLTSWTQTRAVAHLPTPAPTR